MILGRRTFNEIKVTIIPPLWMWIRLLLYLSISGVLFLTEFIRFAEVVFVLSIFSFLGGVVAAICKAAANGFKRLQKTLIKK